LLNLVAFVRVNLGQEVLNHVLLPVIDRAVTLDLISFEFYILYVETGVVREVSEGHLDELFGKKIVLLGDMGVIKQVQHRLLTTHCSSRHIWRHEQLLIARISNLLSLYFFYGNLFYAFWFFYKMVL